MVWNLPMNGWCFSGGFPLLCEETCSQKVTFLNHKHTPMAEAEVRWVGKNE
jgi:hypothetical protein